MNVMLVRVGADKSVGGGSWNGPVNSKSCEFAYVAIPEYCAVHPGLEKPYIELEPVLAKFGVALPGHLRTATMHLDPDFEHLTYGDGGERAKQIRAKLKAADMILFYAGLKDVTGAPDLVYAFIGLFEVEALISAGDVPEPDRDINAHSRRILEQNAADVIVRGRVAASGRLRQCLPIGEYRDRAYRVRTDLIEEWGGLSNKDGYIQRSARLPLLLDPARFMRWLDRQQPVLIQTNNQAAGDEDILL